MEDFLAYFKMQEASKNCIIKIDGCLAQLETARRAPDPHVEDAAEFNTWLVSLDMAMAMPN